LNDPDREEIEEAAASVGLAVSALHDHQRRALAWRALGDAGADRPAVKERQARNLVKAARLRLWSQPALREAFVVLCRGFARCNHPTAALCACLPQCLTTCA
jgi:hypothetical protein